MDTGSSDLLIAGRNCTDGPGSAHPLRRPTGAAFFDAARSLTFRQCSPRMHMETPCAYACS
jgi:hypothetical protein